MKEERGAVVYTDIKWEVMPDPMTFGHRARGVVHYGYGIDTATLDRGKHIEFVYDPNMLHSLEAGKHNAESQIAQVIVEYVEEMGAKDAKCINGI